MRKSEDAEEDGSVDDVRPVDDPPPEPEAPEPEPPVVDVEFFESPEPEPEPLSPEDPDLESSPPDEPLSGFVLSFLDDRREAAGVELGARLSAAVGAWGLGRLLVLRGA